jgi:tRNA(Ile)-lysidine synthase
MASSRNLKSADRAGIKARAGVGAASRLVRQPGIANDLASRVAQTLRRLVKREDRLLVGLSGGVDSMVLLDLLTRISKRAGWKLAAMHVNHRLSPNAAKWAAFCRGECRERGVPLRVVNVNVARGNSTEAAARTARYAAFRKARSDCIVLAHNLDDQCETLLLNLLRGAGVKGLAAMPVHRAGTDDVRIIRPLLDVPRSEIEAYARERNLQWIEDESNADSYYLRNFLRRDVFPRIAERVPAYRTTLARAAVHLGEAAGLLDDLAKIDAHSAILDGALTVSVLRRLPDARARNLLRYFLASKGITMPDAERLTEALRQALMARDDADMRIDLGDRELRRFNGALYLVSKYAQVASEFRAVWQGEKRLRIPELGGDIEMAPSLNTGISAAKLRAAQVTIRTRQGGERLQPDAHRPRRTLKNLFQTLAIPPWRRERLPLLWCGGDLVWVPGMGVDCHYQARRGEAAIAPHWRADE